jgi:hypothetical protein
VVVVISIGKNTAACPLQPTTTNSPCRPVLQKSLFLRHLIVCGHQWSLLRPNLVIRPIMCIALGPSSSSSSTRSSVSPTGNHAYLPSSTEFPTNDLSRSPTAFPSPSSPTSFPTKYPSRGPTVLPSLLSPNEQTTLPAGSPTSVPIDNPIIPARNSPTKLQHSPSEPSRQSYHHFNRAKHQQHRL